MNTVQIDIYPIETPPVSGHKETIDIVVNKTGVSFPNGTFINFFESWPPTRPSPEYTNFRFKDGLISADCNGETDEIVVVSGLNDKGKIVYNLMVAYN